MTDEFGEIATNSEGLLGEHLSHNGSNRIARINWICVLLAIFAIGVLGCLFIPATRTSRGAAHRAQCLNNIRNISLALIHYETTYHELPPAFTVDVSGRRLHSWRTLILPFLDQEALYRKIDLSKAWNDPVNADAVKTSFYAYSCASADHPANYTTYFAVITPKSAMSPLRSRALSEVTDATRTLLVTEVDTGHAVPWMSPTDADEEMFLAIGPKSKLAHEGVVNMAFADGHALSQSVELSADERREMIFIDNSDKPRPETRP